jgi:hypothetical protein
MPPCFRHSVQPQARTGIAGPAPGQSKVKRILPQWQLPLIRLVAMGSGMSVPLS